MRSHGFPCVPHGFVSLNSAGRSGTGAAAASGRLGSSSSIIIVYLSSAGIVGTGGMSSLDLCSALRTRPVCWFTQLLTVLNLGGMSSLVVV